MKHTIIIAEIGVNHNGSTSLAKQLIDVAAEAKVDYVKFQTFRTENLVTRSAQKANYQKNNMGNATSSQYAMLKSLELTKEQHLDLKEYCKKKDVNFFSTAFDLDSIDFLESLNMPLWKIPSGEITNFPYLRKIGTTKKPVILSTGMSTLQEIEDAINVLKKYGTPKQLITLLHCTTEYPAPKDEVNLHAMDTMRTKFGLDVGYSDHTAGIEISIAAVAMGATIIEKHLTLSRKMDGPDHKASIEPTEFKKMVTYIRNIEKAMGDGKKEPAKSEIPNIAIARKSIVAACNIRKGELFTEENLTTKRTTEGISPMIWEDIIGTNAHINYEKDQPIVLK